MVDPPSPAPLVPTAPPPPVWPVFVGFIVAFFGISIVSMIPIGIAIGVRLSVEGQQALRGDPTQLMRELMMQPWVLVAGMTISTVGLAIAALIGARLSKQPITARLRIGPERFSVLNTVLLLIAVLCVGQVSASLAELAGAYQGSLLEQLSRIVHEMPLGWFIGLLVVGCLGAGFGEELFFRGFMQTRLRQRWSKWAAIATTAAFFGLLHADPLHTPLAFLLGLVLGWGAELQGDIRPCIAAHTLNNLTSFLLSRFAFEADSNVPLPVLALIALTGLAAIAGLNVLNRDPLGAAVGAA